MMDSLTLERYARVLVWGMKAARREPLAPGAVILVRADLGAVDLACAVQRELMRQEMHAVVRLMPPSTLERGFYEEAQDRHLTFRVPGDQELFQNLDGLISLLAPDSNTHLRGIAPAKIAAMARTRKYLRDIMETREAQGVFGWTLCLMPTDALARDAGLSPEEYEAEIVRAAYLDDADPVARWEATYRQAQRVKAWLNALDLVQVQVRSASMDLSVGIGASRQWIGVTGHNIPSFELFLSPDCRETRGVYYADQPSYRSGNLVRGVTLQFEDGRCVAVRAEEGEEFVRSQLAMDEGASRLGEFSLTDKRFSPIRRFMAHTLFDENFGGEHGNCHIAVGASYSDTYAGDPHELTAQRRAELGFNDSALHWDLVNTEPKTVIGTRRNGEQVLVYENGMFACELDG
jgi:aminopeptidase